jgi:hypothetical protein
VALVACLQAGCLTGTNDVWIDREPRPETRAELYRRFGPPDAIRRKGEDVYLRYDYFEDKGMMLGARYFGLGLVLERNGRALDRVWVRVAPDGRVRSFAAERGTPDLGYRLWPFGD